MPDVCLPSGSPVWGLDATQQTGLRLSIPLCSWTTLSQVFGYPVVDELLTQKADSMGVGEPRWVGGTRWGLCRAALPGHQTAVMGA